MKIGMMLIGIAVLGMLAIGCGETVVVTATPTVTVQPLTATPEPTATVQPPTATPEPTATVQPPTATPEPTATVQPLTGLAIRERWEALAEAGLVFREEKKVTISGGPNSRVWVQADVVLFTVPEGLGGWKIQFGKEGDRHFSKDIPDVGYERAHNIWVHILQMSGGKVEKWSPTL